MTSPISNSSTANTQMSEEKKKVSWGNNTVVIVEPSYHVPKDCSKTNEAYLVQLMDARAELKRALSQPKSGAKKAHVITVLSNIISSTEGVSDPIARTIYQVSHVLLARAYFGMFYGAYLEEMKVIEADPEMKKKHDHWQELLSADSIFA